MEVKSTTISNVYEWNMSLHATLWRSDVNVCNRSSVESHGKKPIQLITPAAFLCHLPNQSLVCRVFGLELHLLTSPVLYCLTLPLLIPLPDRLVLCLDLKPDWHTHHKTLIWEAFKNTSSLCFTPEILDQVFLNLLTSFYFTYLKCFIWTFSSLFYRDFFWTTSHMFLSQLTTFRPTWLSLYCPLMFCLFSLLSLSLWV